MRAYLDYDPRQDYYIPCPEAGLKFERGAILQIVNQDDPNWWQAVQYSDAKDVRAGLVPSKVMREKLVKNVSNINPIYASCIYIHRLLSLQQASGQKYSKKKGKKSMYSSTETEGNTVI